jgi:hypothetical protein
VGREFLSIAEIAKSAWQQFFLARHERLRLLDYVGDMVDDCGQKEAGCGCRLSRAVEL